MAFSRRQVSCHLDAVLGEPTGIVLAVAVADEAGLTIDETLDVRLNDAPLELTEVRGPGGTRWHTAQVEPGMLSVRYAATVEGCARDHAVAPHDRVLYVRPSRYVQSDELEGLLGDDQIIGRLTALPEVERVIAARDWIAERLDYVPGSTSPTDGLPEVLATGEGVCRDYAHLLAGILRATDLPARIVSVYAPQLEPMDFHAVVEAAVDDQWVVLDATGLAPREGMLRIATGRDAADTAFLANDGSALELTGINVTATADQKRIEHPAALVHLG
ncbi:MAG: transglutaminase family protein [Microcella sp.]|nr:transglutaminase family protein [Microcella sp.]